METRNNIELTPEQKGVLDSMAQETGESTSSLIDTLLGELQERLHSARVNSHQAITPKPIWAKIRDAFDNVPEEEMAELPTDGAAQIDHYAYGLPKRP